MCGKSLYFDSINKYFALELEKLVSFLSASVDIFLSIRDTAVWFWQMTSNESEGDCLCWCHIIAPHIEYANHLEDPYRFPPFTEIGQIFPSGSETHEKGGFTELKSKTFPPWSQTPLEADTFAVQCFGSLLLVIQSSHQCTGVCLISTKMKNMHSFFWQSA